MHRGVTLREMRPRGCPASVLLGHRPAFLSPNYKNSVGSSPLDHPGAASTPRGRSAPPQIKNIRPLGPPITTGADVHELLELPPPPPLPYCMHHVNQLNAS